VAVDWRPRAFLALAIILNVVYWIVPQGFGGSSLAARPTPTWRRCSCCWPT